ncbi:MAG: hypothetical protein AVO34_00865 [Firmicutes bacterium ML8_F2]|nr:MAG: hypothetical protein AVO34_00865 [Firmicutes bacterium ML8_F2]
MKDKKPVQNNIILTIMLIIGFITASVLIAGCRAERPVAELMENEEEIDNMEQAGHEKIIKPPIDRNIPEGLATATLAMG